MKIPFRMIGFLLVFSVLLAVLWYVAVIAAVGLRAGYPPVSETPDLATGKYISCAVGASGVQENCWSSGNTPAF